MPSQDNINHPSHYTQGIECIDYIMSQQMGYLEGNIIKYVTRYKLKHGVEDLRKAEWYLNRLIAREALGAVKPSNPAKPAKRDWAVWTQKPDVDSEGVQWGIPVPAETYPDSSWPSPAECAKPLRVDAVDGLYPSLDLEKIQEVRSETAQAQKESRCAYHCDNYIKPHFPKLDGRNCR